MSYEELCSFIKRYATQYRPKTAMLLTGDWGSGKSYYVNKTLCPYLKDNAIEASDFI